MGLLLKISSLHSNINRAKHRPFLKWAGGKYRCIEHLLASLPPAKRLIEPFAGSGVVFLNTHYTRYLLADSNQDLTSLFKLVKQEGSQFTEQCRALFIPENNQAERYYELRAEFNHCTDQTRRACLFLYLNRHGYNGLCRYNLKGGYNVPFGRYKKPYFPAQEMRHFHEKSQCVQIKTNDFRDTFRSAEPGDVIYCDPPYAPRDQRSNFSAYTRLKFGEREQIHLAELAREQAKQGVVTLISNHDTPFTRYHYQGAQIIPLSVTRSISCNSERRSAVGELLAIFR